MVVIGYNRLLPTLSGRKTRVKKRNLKTTAKMQLPLLELLMAVATFCCCVRFSDATLASGACESTPLAGDCGENVCVRLVGSPWQHVWTTEDGYSLCRVAEKFFFAEESNGKYSCSEVELACGTKVPPFSVPKKLLPELSVPEMEIRRGEETSLVARLHRARKKGPEEHNRLLQASKNLKNLVLMLRWSDHPETSLPPSSDYNTLFNSNGPVPTVNPTGSVKDVYLFNLYGQYAIDNVVTGWISVPYTESQAAGPSSFDNNNGCTGTCGSAQLRSAITWALNKVETDGLINFNDFDMDGDSRIDIFTVVHSGHGAEAGGSLQSSRIWSHKWALPSPFFSNGGIRVYNYNVNPGLWSTSGNSIGRIGVIAHEMGHFLGLPDLYDTDYSSGGISSYGLMANSWGYDNSQRYPPSMSAWSKEDLGVLDIVDITTSGTYTLPAIQDTPRVFRLRFTSNGVTESDYLLIEYRRSTGFDAQAPGGILIFHVDPSLATNRNEGYPGCSGCGWPGNHYKVRVIQADGQFELERGGSPDSADWFRNGGEVSDLTNPSLKAYAYYSFSNKCSGHLLKDFSASGGSSMTFTYQKMRQDCSGLPDNTAGPTQQPTGQPSPLPTTRSPTDAGITLSPTTKFPTEQPTRSTPAPSMRPTVTAIAWNCNPDYYNVRDGCDCECGSWDPDCDLEESRLYCWTTVGNTQVPESSNLYCSPSTLTCLSNVVVETAAPTPITEEVTAVPSPQGQSENDNPTGMFIMAGAAGRFENAQSSRYL